MEWRPSWEGTCWQHQKAKGGLQREQVYLELHRKHFHLFETSRVDRARRRPQPVALCAARVHTYFSISISCMLHGLWLYPEDILCYLQCKLHWASSVFSGALSSGHLCVCGPLSPFRRDQLRLVPVVEGWCLYLSGENEHSWLCSKARFDSKCTRQELAWLKTLGTFGVLPESSSHVSQEQKFSCHLERIPLQRPHGGDVCPTITISMWWAYKWLRPNHVLHLIMHYNNNRTSWGLIKTL